MLHWFHGVRTAPPRRLLTAVNRFEDVLDLPSIGCTLAMRDAYDRVTLPDSQ